MMKSHAARLLVSLLCVSGLLFGCASVRPYRTDLAEPGSVSCPADLAATLKQCSHITPETAPGYELHFVEFDDQGWAVTIPAKAGAAPGDKPPSQIDHLMKRLDKLLGDDEYLNIILYVHGWKHDAKDDDEDVKRFRRILASANTLESSKSRKPRKVVGIYVGWRGKSWDLPNALINMSFWSRKSAALRVSHGAVQELFSRLRTVQSHYNSNIDSPDCAAPREGRITTSGCRVRMLMIGHSFGAWILYSAISGPLISTLNAEKDLDNGPLPGGAGAADNPGAHRKAEANRRPADMIVLINPAFEAVRYQPLHQAAINYKSKVVQPPLLVTITSSADAATRLAFPAGRFINSIFEKPVTSEEQSEAMKRTHGHIDLYQTHQLVARDNNACPGWQAPGPLSSSNSEAMLTNKEIEALNSARFFQQNTDATGLLKANWMREFCGGVTLSQMKPSLPNHNRDPNSLVWNIHTDASLITSHSDIMGEKFLEFVRQLYDDTELRW
ncbi:hypothetical protein Q4S45_16375 [Massilia sp. R2A-15]|uniref:hypothetical protein n=1 Tax=Massilia sp. R2A-15 TaxID=3064278 RepID=UPI0027336073|nr:hypothetical protein [Massilia sp. R2A-15]WLI88300.1 hypothetical protein Q4S45_16375 [Massilia sp. R2A-15]